MKATSSIHSLFAAGVASALATHALGGTMVDKKMMVEPERPINGALTLGYAGSEHLNTGTIDLLQPIHTKGREAAFFYNGRFEFDDNDQEVQSHGLVFRYRLADELIVGVNVYYDGLDSAYGHHFDQLGLGAEILTKWVDARVNYYLPDQKREVFHRSTRREVIRDIETGFVNDEIRDTFLRRDFVQQEAPLEGVNTEIGFLVPGLENVAEVRLFGGYYHYLNPFGSDYKGFKGRLEARIRKGLIVDVEYWDDKVLTGGHWTGGVRLSLPFNLGNIFAGRNPFEGASEAFGPPGADFGDRMSDMVIRSHRVKSASSGPMSSGSGSATSVKRIPKNLPPAGGGGGGDESPESPDINPEAPPK
jgi:hypothetical protein